MTLITGESLTVVAAPPATAYVVVLDAIPQHLCAFDWNWSKRCDRAAIDKQMVLNFLGEATNLVLVGPSASRRWRRTLSPRC
jgi:hypothetical protein